MNASVRAKALKTGPGTESVLDNVTAHSCYCSMFISVVPSTGFMTHSREEEPSSKLGECDPSWGMNRCPGPERAEVGPEQILPCRQQDWAGRMSRHIVAWLRLGRNPPRESANPLQGMVSPSRTAGSRKNKGFRTEPGITRHRLTLRRAEGLL